MARTLPLHHSRLTKDSTFYDRIKYEYAGQKNFYALAYDQDEVIDAVRLPNVHLLLDLTNASGDARKRCSLHKSRLLPKHEGAQSSDPWRRIRGVRDRPVGLERCQTRGRGMSIILCQRSNGNTVSYSTIITLRTSARQARIFERFVDAAHRIVPASSVKWQTKKRLRLLTSLEKR